MPKKPDLMQRTRAAVCYLNTKRDSAELEMYAFLSLFHPEIDEPTKREIARKGRRLLR